MTDTYEVATFDCYGTLIDWEGGSPSSSTLKHCETVTPT
jgi:FMN phosphatase YigB (HAD superfamily)